MEAMGLLQSAHRTISLATRARSSRAVSPLQLVFFAIDRWSATCLDGRVGSTSSVHAQVSHVKWHHKVYAGFEPVISPSHATAFAGIVLLLDPDLPSLVQCSSGCPPKSTTRNPSNAYFLGLRCWVSSIS
ncbi:hypothetical protein PHYSODRAFT_354668 [Phytophthora sojae]|uniref:Uncharacterized protein n=1 Tax=Phytophthora sojae (strain P6497) TaxID=1094619 RepID=G4ZED2_PHYSP|nr:hypothetical protein PHYSODRAFT_354668 [Phytophthora sojae]EGZ18397.1 hypothetical protein PHYSODRAFT_354668 [Phytophthora sojae]|eukprot:XP_009527455.1 hypothetical protein PHYSODRAFT_354668 [Phytophthora sojae]